MPIPLPEYIKVKDNYCLAYFGNSKEYLVQLRLLRPFMEKQFPGVKVFLCCKDCYFYLLKNEERILTQTELQSKKNEFAYVRELTCNMQSHPIEEFMNESSINFDPIQICKIVKPASCVLLTNGILPVKSLTGHQIQNAINFIKSNKIEPLINTDIDHADWVVGVENENLVLAGEMGKKISLITTGFGENLFKKMFLNCEILHL